MYKIKIFNDVNPITGNHKAWAVRVVEPRDHYGLRDCLVNEGEPMVEFFDTGYGHTDLGQFVSRYNLSTLLEREEDTGLCLDGGVPSWAISANGMYNVTDWLRRHYQDFSCEKGDAL